jgi:hypothetical protein
MENSSTLFASQNSCGHTKDFLRKLSAVWALALKDVHQPCLRPKKFMGLKGRQIIGLRGGAHMYLVSPSVEEIAVSFPQNIEAGPGAHPVSYSVGIGALSSAIKRPERESVHSRARRYTDAPR